MWFLTLFAFFFAVRALAQNHTTGKLGDAKVVMNNPPMASYVATFPHDGMSKVKGQVTAMSGKGGKGVNFSLRFRGLPKEAGPFSEFLQTKSQAERSIYSQASTFMINRFLRTETALEQRATLIPINVDSLLPAT